MRTIFLLVAVATLAHAQQHLGDSFDDEDNELTSIDVQEGDTVKLECRCVGLKIYRAGLSNGA